jgi:hypothetical protein
MQHKIVGETASSARVHQEMQSLTSSILGLEVARVWQQKAPYPLMEKLVMPLTTAFAILSRQGKQLQNQCCATKSRDGSNPRRSANTKIKLGLSRAHRTLNPIVPTPRGGGRRGPQSMHDAELRVQFVGVVPDTSLAESMDVLLAKTND